METGYILVWSINDYYENGGGINWQLFKEKSDALDVINQMVAEWEYKFEVLHFSHFSHKVEIEPVNIIKQYRIK